jgi:hypothetical protein
MKFENAGAAVSTVSRRRRVRLCALVPLFALVVFLGPPGLPFSAEASSLSCADTSVLPPFQAARGVGEIYGDLDFGGTGCWALNFTGSTGSAGDTWMAVYSDPEPIVFGGAFLFLDADVLIHRFNNKKGAGLFALYNEEPGKKGLALILYDAGNTDSLVLATVDQNGRLAKLTSVSLGGAILENTWYHLHMQVAVSGDNVTVNGAVSNDHGPVGSTLAFGGPRPAGVEPFGEFGIIASAVNTRVDSSVTNFQPPAID